MLKIILSVVSVQIYLLYRFTKNQKRSNMKNALIGLFAMTLTIYSCEQSKKQTIEQKEDMIIEDVHSFAKPNEAVITHLDWKANVDFEAKVITATATFLIDIKKNTDKIVLDTKGLEISGVTDSDGNKLSFSLGEEVEFLGSPLVIKINSSVSSITIAYSSSPEAEALQWLNPTQTAGKKHPFLFTQSQAILARTWIPVQDSPGIRFTYNAEVTVPSNLMAVMSAENPKKKNDSGVYNFKMKQRIPAYLMALSVGDIAYASMGDRTGVYAEPSVLESAAYEFAETEKMIVAAEALYGPYQWEIYDLIVLPPSFPFGGMENPRLTFATPTILAGDRSLTSLVAHELAHSWSGNLVTNATWDDFWLNEGFTVYFEQRIMEAVYGRDYSEMLALLSLQGLEDEVAEMIAAGNGKDTNLKLSLKGRNPDDGMTSIAYDKGYNFLRMMEESVGRGVFDTFLREYFTFNAFKVMTTEGFIDYMETNLIKKNGLGMKPEVYNAWIYGEGLPENRPQPTSDKFANVEAALNNWSKTGSKTNLESSFGSKTWSSHEWLHFVRNLPNDLSNDQMKKLDDAFGFTKTGNSEILTAWLMHVISNKYDSGYDRLESFLINTGRRKFLMPLYRQMKETEGQLDFAKSIYQKARSNYHYVSVSSLDELLTYSE